MELNLWCDPTIVFLYHVAFAKYGNVGVEKWKKYRLYIQQSPKCTHFKCLKLCKPIYLKLMFVYYANLVLCW